jgi:hypothetical protein
MEKSVTLVFPIPEKSCPYRATEKFKDVMQQLRSLIVLRMAFAADREAME